MDKLNRNGKHNLRENVHHDDLIVVEAFGEHVDAEYEEDEPEEYLGFDELSQNVLADYFKIGEKYEQK